MGRNLPPGSDTSRAPWNASAAPECPECGETINDERDHAEGCEFRQMPQWELEEVLDERARMRHAGDRL